MTLDPAFDLLNRIPRELILPPANLFLLIVLGLLLWTHWPRFGRALAGTGFAVLCILSSNAGASFFVTPLEDMTAPLPAPARAGAQAIVVLAAGQLENAPEYGNRAIPDVTALARLRYGAHLYRLTGLPVLVSGGNGASNVDPDPAKREYAKADAMAVALQQDFGVPVRWIEPGSRDTAENAAFSVRMLRADGIKRILLVTDAMHMPRARVAFQRAGIEVVEAPTMFFRDQAKGLSAWVPSAEGMRRSWYAVYELIGIAWYNARAGSTAAASAGRAPSASRAAKV
ncbi:YdcF family protein [Massilia sp. S19_KUP03_FR1]|uniref:YdcF family protein n=1 Tax=Massilia sp. S19_KUP03_FR1 TaxID=3025503 RepID=UPI002FCDB99E